jgi:hypothetical protein
MINPMKRPGTGAAQCRRCHRDVLGFPYCVACDLRNIAVMTLIVLSVIAVCALGLLLARLTPP